MEPWWNHGTENQAIDRVHRLGQNRPVYVIRYIIANTVEEKMLLIQERKSRLIGASLTGGQSTTNLEELLTLFD
jgi:DNA repair protein RAD5